MVRAPNTSQSNQLSRCRIAVKDLSCGEPLDAIGEHTHKPIALTFVCLTFVCCLCHDVPSQILRKRRHSAQVRPKMSKKMMLSALLMGLAAAQEARVVVQPGGLVNIGNGAVLNVGVTTASPPPPSPPPPHPPPPSPAPFPPPSPPLIVPKNLNGAVAAQLCCPDLVDAYGSAIWGGALFFLTDSMLVRVDLSLGSDYSQQTVMTVTSGEGLIITPAGVAVIGEMYAGSSGSGRVRQLDLSGACWESGSCSASILLDCTDTYGNCMSSGNNNLARNFALLVDGQTLLFNRDPYGSSVVGRIYQMRLDDLSRAVAIVYSDTGGSDPVCFAVRQGAAVSTAELFFTHKPSGSRAFGLYRAPLAAALADGGITPDSSSVSRVILNGAGEGWFTHPQCVFITPDSQYLLISDSSGVFMLDLTTLSSASTIVGPVSGLPGRPTFTQSFATVDSALIYVVERNGALHTLTLPPA